MKLIPVVYKGFTAMDRRFSSPMLPWIVSEIRKRNCSEKLSLGVEEGVLQAYNQDFELHFGHRVSQMTRFSQADMDPCTFLYLLKNDNEQLLYCYLFQAKTVSDVTDLYKQMKEQNHLTPTRSLSSAANLTSLCVDISPSSSNFFEVLYIGKIKVWQKKIPENFIDEALNKFKAHELEKHSLRQLGNIGKLKSENSLLRRGSTDSTASDTIKEEPLKGPPVPPLLRSQSVHSSLLVQRQPSTDEESPHDPGSRAVIDDHNRTMVLQVDRTDLRLISPDRKVVLLQKRHRDVATCLQGQLNPEHFGFICSEGNNSNIHIGYVFKCESSSIANDAMAAITQAFLHAESRPRHSVSSCEHCPMVWFHKLCLEIENMSDRKTQAAILRRLDQLDEEDRSTILAKFRGAEPDSARDQNDFLMMLVRAHCEARQSRHVHDSPEQRSEFLSLHLGGAGGGATIFSKAKRSLSHSFDQLLKRKASRDDFGAALRGMGIPISNRESHSPSPSINNDMSDRESDGCRSRSSTVGSQNDLRDTHLGVRDAQNSSVSPEKGIANEKGPKSPMLDIFMKVGNSSKASAAGENGSPDRLDSGSWRQAIFKRVITPSKLENLDQSPRRRSKEELRILWKKSIYQAILLVRMEKENARIRAKQEESAVKRIKLEYDEMKPVQRELTEMWEMLTSKEGGGVKCDDQMLLQAIRQGVPRGKRGEVWTFLAERFCLKVPPFDAAKHPNYSVPYETLLKQLTAHQHAILIDLGRTFPNHSYFSSPLGPGQLALFNLLKAYSLLDPEVGYCQGLSFVTGILLLHMEETQAFNLLRHLMFRRGMRSQYLPDMVGLQIKLYQLSRLLHDQLPELYNHFDSYEVAPTLYAAPWLLTVFASQFPLGFVTRVFDLMFIEGPDVIFRVALALLSYHKEKLLICDSFEEIMNYLKIQLPTIDKSIMDKVMKEVFTTDFAKQLNEYKVEYHVLQEETTAVKPHVDALRQQELQNRLLAEQKRLLMAQLEATIANVNRLERTRSLQQTQLNRLEMQNRGLNVTIATLGRFIETLVERNVDVEIPGEVQGILAQLSISERRQRSVTKTRSAGNIDLPLDLQNHPTEKASKFFSDSHSDILRANSTPKIDVTASPTSSVDSGVATPVSPGCLDHHPLSHCDVSFTFNGTRELRSVKNVKSLKGYSADILSK